MLSSEIHWIEGRSPPIKPSTWFLGVGLPMLLTLMNLGLYGPRGFLRISEFRPERGGIASSLFFYSLVAIGPLLGFGLQVFITTLSVGLSDGGIIVKKYFGNLSVSWSQLYPGYSYPRDGTYVFLRSPTENVEPTWGLPFRTTWLQAKAILAHHSCPTERFPKVIWASMGLSPPSDALEVPKHPLFGNASPPR